MAISFYTGMYRPRIDLLNNNLVWLSRRHRLTPAFTLVHRLAYSNLRFFYILCLLSFPFFRSVFLPGLASGSIQASRPYFALSVASTCSHFTFIYRINDQSLAVTIIIISRITPSLAPLRNLHNRRVQSTYHQGTILNSPKLFCELFTNLTARVYNRRRIYDTTREYYPHDILYSCNFSPLNASCGGWWHWATAIVNWYIIQLLASLLYVQLV